MNFRRRVATGIALLAVTFASLWPLVTSAHAWFAGDEMTLCHEAGTVVAPDAVPRPMEPAPARDGPGSLPPLHHGLLRGARGAARDPRRAALPPAAGARRRARAAPSVFHSPVPPSRAPPAASRFA
jgi:hypothetical protein